MHAYTNSVTPDAAANPTPPAIAAPPPARRRARGGCRTPGRRSACRACTASSGTDLLPSRRSILTIPAGTVVTIRMIDNIDSSRNRPGEEFAASLDSPIVVGDRVVVSRGADARVRLVDAKTAGAYRGPVRVAA